MESNFRCQRRLGAIILPAVVTVGVSRASVDVFLSRITALPAIEIIIKMLSKVSILCSCSFYHFECRTFLIYGIVLFKFSREQLVVIGYSFILWQPFAISRIRRFRRWHRLFP